MRILTVRQPWAWAIIHGGKDVENRTRNIAGAYRGPIAIHVSKAAVASEPVAAVRKISGHDRFSAREVGRAALGRVIGVVDLVAVHHANDSMACVDWDHGVTDDGTYLACSPWAMRDHHHLVLTNPRALATPIPAKGRLGLWTPDEGLLWAIRAQIGAPSTQEASA